jgi:hypothetical protein
MWEIEIQQVSLDPNRRLRLRVIPSRWSGYNLIWRDASSVRWDDLAGELYVLDVPEFTPLDEFKQIVSAVACEYGDRLILSPSTVWVGVPSELGVCDVA